MRMRALLFALVASLSVAGFAGAASAVESGEGDHDIGHAEHLCIELLEEGGTIDQCQEAPNPILPEKNEVFWGAFAFLVLLAIFIKFGYPAIKGAMEARSDKIAGDLEQAERTRAEAEGVLAQYHAQLADARAESSRIIEEARAQAEQVRRDLIAKAEAEAVELRQRNAEQISAERGRVMGEVQGQVAALAVELAEKVVESNLDREANMRLIESYINSVGAR